MGTPHNDAKFGEIAKTVIMPGDPKRAKFIAETYITDAKLVSDVRGILAFTGKYKGKDVTIMASGMGIPSMGIYSYELFKFYDVDNIIRIGSSGAMVPEMNMFDIVLSKQVYTEGNYALSMGSEICHLVSASEDLNNKLKRSADKLNYKIIEGNTVCSEAFDPYMFDLESFISRMPKDLHPIASEMEAFSLFYNAKKLNKNASCLMTIVDSMFKNAHATSEERENGLNRMIEIALDSI